MSKAFEDRVNSYIYLMVTYRDTALLENRHSSGNALDMDFYDEMFWELHKQFTWFHKIYCKLQGNVPETKEEKRVHMMAYNYMKSADKWDDPIKVRDRFQNDLAGFILDGEFLKACKEGKKLSDPLMKVINKDIRNRYYTLLSRGIIDTRDYSKEVGLREEDVREQFGNMVEDELRFIQKTCFTPKPEFNLSPTPEYKFCDLMKTPDEDIFPLAVINVRTTGSVPGKDEIIEAAAIKYDKNFTAVNSFHIYCRPVAKFDDKILEANDMYDDFVETCLPFLAYGKEVQAFFDGCNICGYDLKKQIDFLHKSGADFDSNTKCFNVLAPIHTLLGNPVNPDDSIVDDFKLKTVLDYYKIYGNDFSHALEECLLITKLTKRIIGV